MAVEIQKTLCGGAKPENLTESTCFYLKFSRVYVFCSNFSRVRMFCDDDHLKLVPESTRPGGFPSRTIVDNLTKNSKVNIYYSNERFDICHYKQYHPWHQLNQRVGHYILSEFPCYDTEQEVIQSVTKCYLNINV